MDQSLTLARPPRIPALAASRANPFDALLTGSGPAFMELFEACRAHPPADLLAPVVDRARTFLEQGVARATCLHEAAETVPDRDLTAALLRFVGAWPNASSGDLAAYGAQLAQDVIDRQPSRYALDEALRRLRQTSRFLPAIAEVLATIDAAQTRLRNTLWHLDQIEAMLARHPAEGRAR